MGDIEDNRNEGDGNNDYKKSFPPIRRSISITSLEEEQNGVDDIDDDKSRGDLNYRQKEDEEIRKN
jgi:hypothetical protein